MKPIARWQVGYVLPRILAVLLVVDVLLRLVPLEHFAFRPWEVFALNPASDGPFTANKSLEIGAAYGDLARFVRSRSIREYHAERFTTDAHGFRNEAAALAARPVSIMITGDSFTAGAALSDHDTLPRQVADLTGRSVYNAGGQYAAGLADLIEIMKRLDMRQGTVVYEYLERFELPLPAANQARRYGPPTTSPDVPLRRQLDDTVRSLRISRVKGLLWELRSPLPELGAKPTAIEGRLSNGELTLFHDQDVTSRQDRIVEVQFFKALQVGLKAMGVDLVVLLVPTKYTIYSSHLAAPADLGGRAYLHRIESALEDNAIRVVNVEPLLRERADAAYARGEYLYRRDDTHWNPAGVHVAAEQLATVIAPVD